MTNMNNQIMKLEVYKSVYMFDTNGCGFTHVSFYLPTMTNGRKLERWNYDIQDMLERRYLGYDGTVISMIWWNYHTYDMV